MCYIIKLIYAYIKEKVIRDGKQNRREIKNNNINGQLQKLKKRILERYKNEKTEN